MNSALRFWLLIVALDLASFEHFFMAFSLVLMACFCRPATE